MTLKCGMTRFLYVTLPINLFSADPLLLESPLPLGKKQLLISVDVLVFEQGTKQTQLNAEINNDSFWTHFCDLP